MGEETVDEGVTYMIVKMLKVTSPAFGNNGVIPKKYTGHGANVSPPLCIEGIPLETKSLALIMVDVDVPFGHVTHWVVWNIPPNQCIEENSAPGTEGKNTLRKNSYVGPRPPFGTHRYLFKIYALDTTIALDAGKGRKELQKAIENHALAEGALMGLYPKT